MHVLDAGFACNSLADVAKLFVIDQLIDVVARCEGVGVLFSFVLGDAYLQLSRDTGVEALAFAGEDVGVTSFFNVGSLWLRWGKGKGESQYGDSGFARMTASPE